MPVVVGAGAGVVLAVTHGMVRLVALLALLASCKSMGHLGSGLGHIASATSHVASGLGHVASAAGHVAAPVARGLGQVAEKALPAAETVLEAAALAPGYYAPADPFETPDDPPAEVVSMSGPLIDNHDPCNACPADRACDQCVGDAGVACRWTPPDAFTRCESGTPR